MLFSICYSGDGNFHLQSRLLVKRLAEDPSFFEDAGFFVPYEKYKNYTEAAIKNVNQKRVRLHSLNGFFLK